MRLTHAYLVMYQFLSTPSARRATHFSHHLVGVVVISIHALREEGDSSVASEQLSTSEFLSTPSARRATKAKDSGNTILQFLSTPSARRATDGRADQSPLQGISIHALREEGDLQGFQHPHIPERFLSTPSARRATYRLQHGL